MFNKRAVIPVFFLLVIAIVLGMYRPALAGKPTIAPQCKQCHQSAPDVIRGTFAGFSEKFKSLQVATGSLVWVIKYGDDLKISGDEKLSAISMEKEVAVRFTGGDKHPYAVNISIKPPAKVPPERLVSVNEMVKLTALGPEKGSYLLIDARSPQKYKEGHLPYAVSMPFERFEKYKDKTLPKEKDKLIIFYCYDMTCQLCPAAAHKTEELGYTKVKIFHAGMTGWEKSGNLVVSEPAYLKDLIEKDIAHILIDLRDSHEAQKEFIAGAVSIPMKDLAASKGKFPPDLSAPVILYSSDGSEEAFKIVRGWGYEETSALRGGLAAWKQAGGQVATGKLDTVISYVPKPRPGEVSIEEFKELVKNGAKDKVILDVRDVEETANGMLKGAINVPTSQIKDRLSEIPKDKEIIVHCATGIRAEMAHDDLVDSGYNTRFLNAVILINKDGQYEIIKK